jgi:hypothetical protein
LALQKRVISKRIPELTNPPDINLNTNPNPPPQALHNISRLTCCKLRHASFLSDTEKKEIASAVEMQRNILLERFVLPGKKLQRKCDGQGLKISIS